MSKRRRSRRKTRVDRTRNRFEQRIRRLTLEILESRRLLSLTDYSLSSSEQSQLSDGLDGLTRWADSLDDHGLMAQSLPAVGRSVGDSLDIGDLLTQGVAQPLQDYLLADATPTTAELASTLEALDAATFDNVALTVTNVVGGLDSVENEIVFQLEFQADRTFTVNPSLGPEGDGLGIDFSSTIGASSTLTFNFSFGLDLASGLSDEEAFFIRPGSLAAEVDANAASISSGPASVGFFGGQLTSGHVALDANLAIAIANPDFDAAGRVTLKELESTSLPSLALLTDSGSASGSATIDPGELGSFAPSGSTTITFNSSNPFITPTLSFDALYSEIQGFTNISSFSFLGVLDQLGNWLADLGSSSVLDGSVELAASSRIGDLVSLDETVTQGLIAPLLDGNEIPVFSTAQELAIELAAALGVPIGTINPEYDPIARELTYRLVVSEAQAASDVPVGFSINLNPVDEFTSSSTATLNATNELDLVLGIDLTDFSVVMTSTSAAPANGQLSQDSSFVLNLGLGGDVPVTLTAASTSSNLDRNDLVADFNAALATAGLSGLVVAGLDSSHRLTLTATVPSNAVAALGLTAGDYHPQGPRSSDPIVTELGFREQHFAFDSLANHAFLENATIGSSIAMVAADIDGTAELGFVDASVVDGSGASIADFSLQLKDPATQVAGGRVGLFELFDALSTDITMVVDAPTLGGALGVSLPLTATILGQPISSSPHLSISWPDIGTGQAAVQLNQGAELLQYASLTGGDFADALNAAVDYLASLDSHPLLNHTIVGIDQTLGELLSYAEPLVNFVAAYDANPARALGELSTTLEAAFGIEPGGDDSLSLSLVENGDVIRIDLALAAEYVEQKFINLVDPEDNAKRIIDLRADAVFNTDLSVDLNLSFGIDVSDPGSYTPVIYESTGLSLGGEINVQDINMSVNWGPLGIFLVNGTFLVDADNDATTRDQVQVAIGLTDNNGGTTDGRINLSALDFSHAELSVTGQVHLLLPLYFPTPPIPLTDWTFLGNVEFTIGDLGDILNTTSLSFPNAFSDDGTPDVQKEFALADSVHSFINGLDSYLVTMINVLRDEVDGVNLSFIGGDLHQLGDELEKVRQEITSEVTDRFKETENNSAEALRTGIFLSVGPDGLDILKDRNGDGQITEADIALFSAEVDQDGKVDVMEFRLSVGQDLATLAAPVDFDVGLPGLSLDVEGQAELALGYDWEMAFGISNEFGFYILTDPEDEISFQIEARTPDLRARGELGFLQIDVTDEDADGDPNNPGVDVDQDGKFPSRLSAAITIDLIDPDPAPLPVEGMEPPEMVEDGDRFRQDEFIRSDFFSVISQSIDFQLQGEADINLDLAGSYEGDPLFPTIAAEFEMDWTFEFLDSDTPGGGGSSDIPVIAFNNVTLNAGQFITDFALPILKEVRDFTKPLQPIVDFITTPVPILDSFGFNLTPLEVAEALGYATEVEYIEAIAEVVSAVNSVPEVSGQLVIPLGSYTIVEPDGNGGTEPVDLREDRDLDDAMPNVTVVVDPVAELHAADPDAGGFFDTLTDIGLAIPLVQNPASVFRLLMGQSIDLLTYDIPPLALSFPFPLLKIGPLIPPIPLFAAFSGNVGAKIDLAVGFDTSGFKKAEQTGDWYDIFDGFYVSDRENPDGTGKDVPEATLSGRLNAGVELSLVVASAGVSGGVDLALTADLVDPNGDGKVHFGELQGAIDRLTRGGGLTGAFDLGGSVSARLDAYVELLLSKRFEFNLAEFEISSFEFTDEELFQDRFTANDAMTEATPLGAGPGLHVGGLSIETPGDVDWYQFELLRLDSVDVDVRLREVHGGIDLEVYDSSGTRIAEGKSTNDRDVASLTDVPAGSYFVRVAGAGQLNNYELSVEPGSTSQTRVLYLNPAGATDRTLSYYSTAPGSDVFDGLSPRKPKATLQDLLDDYDLGPNDLITVDTGAHAPGGILTADDEGATYVGSIGSGHLAGVRLAGSDENYFYGVGFSGSGTNLTIEDSDNNLFELNKFMDVGHGVQIAGDGVNDSAGNRFVRNEFQNGQTSIAIFSQNPNLLEGNTFTETGAVGVHLAPGTPATLVGNDIAGRTTGILWESRIANVWDNDIRDNTVGIEVVGGVVGPDNPAPYGTPGGRTPNRVFSNATGVFVPGSSAGAVVRHTDLYSNLVGIDEGGDQTQLVANNVRDNDLGIRSSRVVGPDSWEQKLSNLIHNNVVGVEALPGAEVRFNRIYSNEHGVKVVGTSFIHHNLLYRNAGSGIDPGSGLLVSGANDVDLLNNTIYAPGDHGIRLEGSIRDIRIRNNIVYATGGFGLYVEAGSQFGYESDYNNYFATGSGGVAFQGKGFYDLYDWQVEAESDLHSIGKTVLHWALDDPKFVDLPNDDYHLLSGSTSIDAGDPTTASHLEPLGNGNRVNLGAYGNTPQATQSPSQRLEITAPNFYVDLIPTHSYPLAWESNNLGSVDLDIDLMEEGVGKVADVATIAASAGSTTWTPGDFVAGDNLKRYRLRLTTLSGPLIAEESREPFAIVDHNPAASNTFYVNDNSTADDEYATAVGDNRNTGLTANAPKLVVRPLVLSYAMDAGDVVRVDAGDYVHAVNLNLSGNPLAEDPRMNKVTSTSITGPATGPGVARIDRANPFPGSVGIDMIDADSMALDDLTFVGANIGVRARGGSEFLDASRLTLSDHGRDGLSIEGGSDLAELDSLEVFNNGRHGVFVDSTLSSLTDSNVYDNLVFGIALRSVEAPLIVRNDVYQNFRGIDVINPGASTTVVGSIVLPSEDGNLVHDNLEDGLFASGNVEISGNLVYRNANIGIRLEDGADAALNVVREHATGISALGSSSDITENRSYLNSDTGIAASHNSHILRNVTYNNGVYGIHATLFSGVIDHNLIYSTGYASLNVEGAGQAAQITHNTIYEPCAAAGVHDPAGPATVMTEWDMNVFMNHFQAPFEMFGAALWGGAIVEFQDAVGATPGATFDLGPGGGTGAQTPLPLPEGETWTIDYQLLSIDLSSAMSGPIPGIGVVEATLMPGPASFGQLEVTNISGVLTGTNQMELWVEFHLTETGATLVSEVPVVVDYSIEASHGFGANDVLKIPAFIPSTSTTPGALANAIDPADPWEWDLQNADATGDPDPPPQDLGETCAAIGILLQNNSDRASLRQNAVWVQGDPHPEPGDPISIDIVVDHTSTHRFDSDFNAFMTDFGIVGDFGGAVAPTLTDWQNATGVDMHSVSPNVGTVWVDPDGGDNMLGGLQTGNDDNFHAVSPFGHVDEGALAPVSDAALSSRGLPMFTPVTWVAAGGSIGGLSSLVDAGDPAALFGSEPVENGMFANIGVYGNTLQASHSEPEYVHLVYPIGAEQIVPGQTYEILWRSHDLMPSDMVEIELTHGGIGGTLETTIDPAAPNTGSYFWTVPPGASIDTDYSMVITRPSVLSPGLDIEGESPFAFTIDLDSRPPLVLNTSPPIIELERSTNANVASIMVDFSENVAGGGAVSNYSLVGAGPNGVFDSGDNGDDIPYNLSVSYSAAASDGVASTATLTILAGTLPEDDYRLTVKSTIADNSENALNGVWNSGASDYVRRFSIDRTAPTVSIPAISPDPRNGAVQPLTVVFDEPVEEVGLADVRLTRDGGPNLLSGTEALTSADGIAWDLGDVTSLTQEEGVYSLQLTSLDSNIRDLAGNLLTSDASATWTVDSMPPTVDIVDVAPDPRNTAVGQIDVVFSEAVQNFTLADVELLLDGVSVNLLASQAPTTSDNITWTLGNLSGLTALAGSYLLKIKDDGGLTDIAGNALAAEEREAWQVLVGSPRVDIVDVTPDPRTTDVDEVVISFDRPVTGFDASDLTLLRDANPVSTAGLLTTSTLDSMNWRVTGFATATSVNGAYELTLDGVGAGIQDLAGNTLTGTYVDSWTRDDVPPTVAIAAVSPDPTNQPIDELTITFSKAVGGLHLAHLTLTRDTVAVPWDGGQTLTTADGVAWTLSGLAPITGGAGTYEVTLDASSGDIEAFPGNPLLVGSTESWLHDPIAPTVTMTPVTPFHSFEPIDSVQIVFSEPVGHFDLGDLVLRRQSLVVPLTGSETLTTSDNQTWLLANLSPLTDIPAKYELGLPAPGSGIEDAVTNALTVGTFTAWRRAIPGDISGDGRVGLLDLGRIQQNFGIASGAAELDGDLTGDAAIDRDDVAALAGIYNSTAPAKPYALTYNGAYEATFADLASAYATFLPTPEHVVGFDGLSGVLSPTQYTASHGLTFSNLTTFGAAAEGEVPGVEDLDGYDGVYEPSGDTVYVNFPNHLTPLTFEFDAPVSSVGSFLGSGVEGNEHTIVVKAFDADGGVIAQVNVLLFPFSDPDNLEGFWAVSTQNPAISKVSILNRETTDFGNTLIIDNLAWSITGPAPLAAAASATTPRVAVPTNEGDQPYEVDQPAALSARTNFWLSLDRNPGRSAREEPALEEGATESSKKAHSSLVALSGAFEQYPLLVESGTKRLFDPLRADRPADAGDASDRHSWTADLDSAVTDLPMRWETCWDPRARGRRNR